PAAPVVGMIDLLLEGAHRRRPDPQIPVEARGYGVLARRAPFVSVDADAPVVDLADLSQATGLDDLHAPAQRLAGAALVPHLRYDLAAAGQLAQLARLRDAV